MPRPPKQPHLRQNTQHRDVGPVTEPVKSLTETPPPLWTWLKGTKESWIRFWTSPGAHITVQSLDLDRLERLWTLYDERARAQLELRKARVVIGSTGQTRASPFYTVIAKLDSEIRILENDTGKSAGSRLKLGMVVGSGERTDDPGDEPEQPSDTAGDHNRRAAGEPGETRLYVVDGRTG